MSKITRSKQRVDGFFKYVAKNECPECKSDPKKLREIRNDIEQKIELINKLSTKFIMFQMILNEMFKLLDLPLIDSVKMIVSFITNLINKEGDNFMLEFKFHVFPLICVQY